MWVVEEVVGFVLCTGMSSHEVYRRRYRASILGMSSAKGEICNFRLCKFLSSKFVCRSQKGAQEKNEIYTTREPLVDGQSIDDGRLYNQTNQGKDTSNIVEQGVIIDLAQSHA